MPLNIRHIETELQYRWHYNYKWFRKQENIWDKHSNFIYSTTTWEELVLKMKAAVDTQALDKKSFFYYTINRWYNFWSAIAIEEFFCQHNSVIAEKDAKNKYVDFYIEGIPFDHKTSVFPKGFGHSLGYAMANEEELITWLYEQQSSEGRQHFKNRLFIIVYAKDQQHWKLKAKLSWLKPQITQFLNTFDASKLHTFQFKDTYLTKSGILWAVE